MVALVDPWLLPDRTGPLLLLLRHAAVASHRGDVPLTSSGRAQAQHLGRRLAAQRPGTVDILVGPTLRARQTGVLLSRALAGASPPAPVTGPSVAVALRNPDLYLAGHRVDMVSTAAAFAEQVPGVTAAEVTGVEFFANFLESADRIGYWLRHPCPPGDDPAAVAARIREFTLSLSHARSGQPGLVLGVTQSPVLRAVAMQFLGADPGEPGFLDGYAVQTQVGSRELRVAMIRTGLEVHRAGGDRDRHASGERMVEEQATG